jgi:hypothetical protein
MNDPEVQEGIELLESIWYLTASSIVELAVKTYGLTPEQHKALQDVFLKQNHYYVTLTT